MLTSLVYPAAVFLGAFLLFVIQPIEGKQLLPLFGGSSSVWATSLAFFTSMLFFGYLYVYVLTRANAKKQVIVHSLVVVASLAFFVIPVVAFFTTGMPFLDVLLALLVSIGLPYFVLSTTGPLLQFWFAATQKKEPYKLYALSNAASLAALAAYPFIIEPLITLRNQHVLWAALFVVYAVLCLAAARGFLRTTQRATPHESVVAPAWKLRVTWIAFAALPAFMLVAITTQLTQVITPMPLLWVVPLALYLVTFIVAFSGRVRLRYAPVFLLIAVAGAYYFEPPLFGGTSWGDVTPRFVFYLLVLFLSGLTAHTLLYMSRPHPRHSPLFYLAIAFGGMLGCIAASIVAPLVFTDFVEFPLGLAACAALAVLVLSPHFFPRLKSGMIALTKALAMLGVVILLMQYLSADTVAPAVSSRNFYGKASVVFMDDFTVLAHGSTIHGAQFTKPDLQRIPTMYYTPKSGVGRAFLFEQDTRKKQPLRAGVVGLGTGALAAYCRAGDSFVFYEIDKDIDVLAKQYFSYLAHCTGSEVRLGDARIVLQSEGDTNRSGKYDILAVDAFSNDTIPAHLLTLEAFQLYASHLRSPQSIIAVHVSNRYLDLAPVVLRLAAELRFSAAIIRDPGDPNLRGVASQWVLLAADSSDFRSVVFANTDSAPPKNTAPVWTDDYSSILPVLRLPWLYWN